MSGEERPVVEIRLEPLTASLIVFVDITQVIPGPAVWERLWRENPWVTRIVNLDRTKTRAWFQVRTNKMPAQFEDEMSSEPATLTPILLGWLREETSRAWI